MSDKYRCQIDLDFETGEYELKVKDLSGKGRSVDYGDLIKFLRKVFGNVTEQIQSTGLESTENFTKEIH